jgi:phosphomannomutase
MKASRFFKEIVKQDEEEQKQEQLRIEKIIKEELEKRLTSDQLAQVEYDEKLKENFEKREGSSCVICLEREAKMAFTCGHKVLCKGCRNVFRSDKCPVCRAKYTAIIEIFD